MQTIWSRQFDQCQQCGTTERKHFSRGLCQKCYFAEYNARNAETIRGYKYKWYIKVGGKDWARQQREQRHYANQREPVLRRDGYRCVRCGSPRQLCVHHKDGNGRGKPSPNNAIDNLETLCRACHMREHKRNIAAAKAARCDYWAPKFKLHACRACGRSNQIHRREGLCATCFARAKRSGILKPFSTIGQPRGKWKK